jgi:hypothetical protein
MQQDDLALQPPVLAIQPPNPAIQPPNPAIQPTNSACQPATSTLNVQAEACQHDAIRNMPSRLYDPEIARPLRGPHRMNLQIFWKTFPPKIDI